MEENKLQLNNNKTEAIRFTTSSVNTTKGPKVSEGDIDFDMY